MYYKKGFSLIEISLVLVLTGLLIVTILVSQQLRINTQNRMMIKELSKINIAANQFYDLFNELPGDSSNIYKFWSAECVSAEFCNGNGDGQINHYKESHLSWFHLNLTKFFIGNFSGSGDGDEQSQTIDVNVPKSSIENAQYSLIYYDWNEFPDYNLILLGKAVTGNIGYGAAIDANSAYSIDSKIDDGLPSTGNVLGRNGYKNGNWDDSNCLIDKDNNKIINSENETPDVEYNMNIKTKECIMGIRLEIE
jgi:prepilin-type N-terminal cleavage/methylation domain-containing protein